VDDFLKVTQFDPGIPNWQFPSVKQLIMQHLGTNFTESLQKSNLSFNKEKIMTQEEILSFLHQHDYKIQEVIEELKRNGKSWHPTKPDIGIVTSHHITSHYNTIHYNTSHHITLQHNTLQHITSHHITTQYITTQYITTHHDTIHYNTIHYNTSHLNATLCS
jgi:hypothetical protein